MRAYVKNTGKTLPGWNRQKTKLPTTFMMSTMMNGIMVALTVEGDRYFLRRPQSKQVAFLEALGLDADVFTNKTCQCKLIIPKKIEPKW